MLDYPQALRKIIRHTATEMALISAEDFAIKIIPTNGQKKKYWGT